MSKKGKINWKLINRIGYYLLVSFIVFIGLLVLISFLPVPGDYNLYVVRSGSMKPALSPGDMILTKKTTSYNIDDIITFDSPAAFDGTDPVTHRIVDKEEVSGEIEYTTKGDVNRSPDSDTITRDKILGKYQLKVPYIGYLLNFAKTLPGLIILIIIPAGIVIFDEIKKIRKEVIRIKSSKNDKN